MRKVREWSSARQPPLIEHLFISAGAMKSGTTWLYQVLEKHPEIYFCPEKEIHYFYAAYVDPSVLGEAARLRNVRDKYLRIDPGSARAAGVRARLRWAANYLDGPVDDLWYRNLFAFAGRQRYVADFSNLYALLPADGWRRVVERTGQLRVIYTMRHPLRRLWSHVKFHLQVTGQSDKLATWGTDEYREFVYQPFIWDNAEYGRALRAMHGSLDDDMLSVSFYEDVHRDRAEYLHRIEAFLGLERFEYPSAVIDRQVNATENRKMPPFFAELFASDLERICAEVRGEGYELPESWEDLSGG